MEFLSYSDTVLVPLSLFLTIGYHAYLFRVFKSRPTATAIGIDSLKRKEWFFELKDGDDKKGMLVVQSMRNTKIITILTATLSVLVNMALAALMNNAYASGELLGSSSSIFLGSRSGRILMLKYGLAALFLTAGFLCSSMAVAHLIEACFHMNAFADFCPVACSHSVIEKGFLLATCGNRLLFMTFPVMMWMFGPVAVAVSSAALVWGFYELDFVKAKARP
ncbi:hypothetical protein MLD38_021524 [Melastoma candidum]|uniref:Uncharacterized protein n=1 Tax=Melastoma candidum TaxID=119954 RepID=A0ACB9QI62_9MYRT|nr:hypothetical protein MLD38_021524 [Melastoma candidum]